MKEIAIGLLFGLALAVAIVILMIAQQVPTQWHETSKAFDVWAEHCKPTEFHYGVTEDEHGTRAFIVTCSPKE